MLLLLFQIKENHFALDANLVVEVIPLLNFKPMPQTPDYVVGKINYRGKAIPVIDLCLLKAQKPAAERISTRIILVNYPYEHRQDAILGLVAEQVTETIRPPATFSKPAESGRDEAIYLEDLGQERQELIQWFELRHKIPQRMVDLLFRD